MFGTKLTQIGIGVSVSSTSKEKLFDKHKQHEDIKHAIPIGYQVVSVATG